MESYNFCEFSIGQFHSNDIFQLSDIKDYEGKTDVYMSMFRFSKDFQDYVNKSKSVSNYPGNISTDFIYFDFDCLESIQTAKEELINFIENILGQYLEYDEIEHLRISFSGSKGFSLAIPVQFLNGAIIPSADLHLKIKMFVEYLKYYYEVETASILATLDFKIYDKVRLFRLNNTINSKSGLYKIPLTFDELINLSIEDIKELAKNKKYVEYPPLKSVKANEGFISEYKNNSKIIFNKPDTSENNLIVLSRDIKPGERNEFFFDLARKYKYKGLSDGDIKDILILKNNSISNPLNNTEINSIVKSVSKYKADSTNEDISREDFETYTDRLNLYKNYLQETEMLKFDLGYPIIDCRLRGIRPGNLISILAETSAGKSILLHNILLKYITDKKKKVCLFSVEMEAEEISERENQIIYGESGYNIEQRFKYNSNGSNDKKIYDNLVTVTKPVSIDSIPAYLDRFRELFGDLGLIAIDHIGLLDSKEFKTDEYGRITNAMKLLKRIAKTQKLPVIIVSQVNRASLYMKDRISLFSGKSSGEVENSSNAVLSFERITEKNFKLFDYETEVLNEVIIRDKENEGIQLTCLNILKNRRGARVQSILEMDKRSIRIVESKLNPISDENDKRNIENRHVETSKEITF